MYRLNKNKLDVIEPLRPEPFEVIKELSGLIEPGEMITGRRLLTSGPWSEHRGESDLIRQFELRRVSSLVSTLVLEHGYLQKMPPYATPDEINRLRSDPEFCRVRPRNHLPPLLATFVISRSTLLLSQSIRPRTARERLDLKKHALYEEDSLSKDVRIAIEQTVEDIFDLNTDLNVSRVTTSGAFGTGIPTDT